MHVLFSILLLSCAAVLTVSAATYEDLRSMYSKLVDDTVPPEMQQKFKDGFAKIQDCISPLVNKIDLNIIENVAAGVTKAGVDCGKKVQDMDESQQQAQFMPCVKQELQSLMSQKNEAEKTMFMEAKGCVMKILKSPSPSS